MLWSMFQSQADNVPKNIVLKTLFLLAEMKHIGTRTILNGHTRLAQISPFHVAWQIHSFVLLSGHMSTGAHHYCKECVEPSRGKSCL